MASKTHHCGFRKATSKLLVAGKLRSELEYRLFGVDARTTCDGTSVTLSRASMGISSKRGVVRGLRHNVIAK